MRSEATSVAEYLEELPDDRRGDLEVVRESMLAAVPSGVVETMNWGMVSYEIPLERYPDTYNGQPSLFAALANQKRHMAIYLHCIYAEPTIRQDFEDEKRHPVSQWISESHACASHVRSGCRLTSLRERCVE